MTQQYLQQNINRNGGVTNFTSAVGADAVTLSGSGDQLAIVNAVVATTVNLPLASEAGFGAVVRIVKNDADGTTAVTPTPAAGDQPIAAAAGVTVAPTTQFASITLVSNGDDGWAAVAFTV
jgi:hypothetical protein